MDPAAYREMAETEDRHWWFCGRRAIAEQFIRSVDLGRDSRILEIGAGTGGNFAMLAKFGQLTAVEMDSEARAMANEKTGRDVLAGFLPAGLPDIGDDYDLICMFDVLEHIKDDSAALDTIYKLLKPGGRLVLTVPAYQWMWSSHDEHLHHFRRYSRNELKRKFADAGFAVERITYTNMYLLPLAILARYFDRLTKGNINSVSTGTKMPHKFVNNIFKFIYSSERLMMKKYNMPFGLGLLAVSIK